MLQILFFVVLVIVVIGIILYAISNILKISMMKIILHAISSICLIILCMNIFDIEFDNFKDVALLVIFLSLCFSDMIINDKLDKIIKNNKNNSSNELETAKKDNKDKDYII